MSWENPGGLTRYSHGETQGFERDIFLGKLMAIKKLL
jgi:hypothetical protein